MKRIAEDSRETKVLGDYDVLVIGGGPAGISASVAAARSGARTLLVERYGFLGGLATAGMVGAFCGFFTAGPREKTIVGGIARQLLDRLKARRGLAEKGAIGAGSGVATYQYNPEVLKYVAEEAVIQAGVEILFHTIVVDVIWKTKGTLLGVVIENKSGRSCLLGKTIIDTTGDGDVAWKAGAPHEIGDGKGSGQMMTTIFRLINVDLDKARELDHQALHEKIGQALRKKEFTFSRLDGVIYPSIPFGMIHLNITGIPGLNGTDAQQLTRAEIEGRRQVFEYLSFLKKYQPGFEQAEVCSIATQVGVRETRRISGEYILKEDEVLSGQKFEDGIALGAWPVEFHDPKEGKINWKYLKKEDDYYSIPMRCLIPQNLSNLLVAGRCISTTHMAQASTRVIGPAFAMGEAAGILAARSAASKVDLRKVGPEKVRKELKQHGAILEL